MIMRYIRLIFLAVLAVTLVAVALANREQVVLHLLPSGVASIFGWDFSLKLPLFIVIFGSALVGIALGFVWEWLREHKFRVDGARAKKERDGLKKQVTTMREAPLNTGDDVLSLLEDAR